MRLDEFVTAVVVSHESKERLEGCLSSLAAAGVPTIVVDNASHDGSDKLAASLGAVVLRNNFNVGYGKANNRGIKSAHTPYCLITNPDISYAPDAVSQLVAAAIRWPEAFLLAPRILEADGKFSYRRKSSLSRLINDNESLLDQPGGDCCSDFLSGASLLVRRDAFLSLGGFDENIFLYYEDDDICRRAVDARLPLVHVHGAIARHEKGTSTARSTHREYLSHWHMAWSKVYVFQKYGLPSPVGAMMWRSSLKLIMSIIRWDKQRQHKQWGALRGAWAGLTDKPAMASASVFAIENDDTVTETK